jgi:hypothetical protein
VADNNLNPTPGLRVEMVLKNWTDCGKVSVVPSVEGTVSYAGTDTERLTQQAQADVALINQLLERYEMRREIEPALMAKPGTKVPTPGLRFDVDEAREGTDKVYFVHTGRDTLEQARIDAAYVNWLIETDELRRAHLAKIHAGGQDLLVDMGDLTRASLKGVQMDADYESMTEDIVQTFNNIVIQGIPPIKALFSMSQAFAIVLGFALRANLPFEIAKNLITQVMTSATAAEKTVRIITRQ